MGLAARSSLVALALTLFPATSMAKAPAAPPAKKQPKNPKKPPPAPTPAPAPEPVPTAPPPHEVQNREDPNAKSPEELAKEKEHAKEGAVKNTALGAMLGVAIPVGPHAGVSGFGFAAAIDFQHHVVPVLALGARVGFEYHLDGHSTAVINGVTQNIASRATVIPITVSARLYPIPEGSAGAPYFLAEPGVFVRFVSQEATDPNTGATAAASAVKANFGVGVGAGYTIKGFDIRAMFHTYDVTLASVRLSVGVLLGYRFVQF